MRSRFRYAMCVKNRGYSASLEVRKVYRVLPDRVGARHKLVRVIDESGEDYLYPIEYFVMVELPSRATKLFPRASA
jgi:hypothetical protein